jgi:hypothetical protein
VLVHDDRRLFEMLILEGAQAGLLEPRASGWEIVVREQGREENLDRLTPPLHFSPNPREIEGWQMVDASSPCPRPYGTETGPENPRRFIFSPEVGRRIDGPKANRSVPPEEVEAIGRFGRERSPSSAFLFARIATGARKSNGWNSPLNWNGAFEFLCHQ